MRSQIFAALMLVETAWAVPVASNLVTDGGVIIILPGQSFTVNSAGPVDNVVINFFTPTLVPAASGTGYLLSTEYTGPPSLLPSAAGLLGTAVASGGFWAFNPSLTLQAGVQYFFYGDTFLVMTPPSSVDPYSGGEAYRESGTFIRDILSDNAFVVDATPVVAKGVPEVTGDSASLPLAFIGLLAGLCLSKSGRNRSSSPG